MSDELAVLKARYDDLLAWVHAAHMGIAQEDEGAVYEAVDAAVRTHPLVAPRDEREPLTDITGCDY
jgi:hypothetical protein